MTPTAAQQLLRQEFAATLRVLGRMGFEMGSAGHVTVADPLRTDRFWANPFGVPFAETEADDIVLVDLSGEVVFGVHDCKAAATQTPIYAVRPDVRAAVHVHGIHTMAFSNLGIPFRALTTESAEIVDLQQLQAQGQSSAEVLAGTEKKIALQRFHGCTTVGATIAEAAFYTMAVERAAYTELTLGTRPGIEDVPSDIVEAWRITPQLADGDFRQEMNREMRAMGATR